MDLVELATSCHLPSATILCSCLHGLASVFWSEPLVCEARFCGWISACGPSQPLFSRLLDESMPTAVRIYASLLLQKVLRGSAAFESFIDPAPRLPAEGWDSGGAAKSTALQLALALNANGSHRFLSHHEGELCTDLSAESAAESVVISDMKVQDFPLFNANALRHAALQLFCSLVATHPGAVQRLLGSKLDLSLPVRVVSVLQLQARFGFLLCISVGCGPHRTCVLDGYLSSPVQQVREMLQFHYREPSDLDIDLARDAVFLLLEISRGVSMQQELEGGSWSAHLISTTGYLVRNEVHPSLVSVALPAKLLQNALTQPIEHTGDPSHSRTDR